MRFKSKRTLYIILGLLTLVILYALKNTSYFARASTFVFAIFFFMAIDYLFRLKFNKFHYTLIIIIATTGILFSPLYSIYLNYDKVLHLINPIIMSFLVFFLVNKLPAKFSTKLFITFSIIVSMLAIWEILEYFLDIFFNMKMQGVYVRDITGIEKLNLIMDKNDDTMRDLYFGAFGTLLFCIYKSAIYNFKKYLKIKH